jgi:enoyl-[acyl-carrier protein] reductase/trans-2-enoyl-CoA reductase (NAD+)
MAKVVVEPRIRGFISLTAHPDGCAAMVRTQVDAVRAAGLEGRLRTALVIGSSAGYGLPSALVAAFGYGADVLGVCFEKEPSDTKSGTAGWYNVAEARRLAEAEGRRYETVNGDAFSEEVKDEVVRRLRSSYAPVDVLVYSLAAPRRRGPAGETWNSVLKPVGEVYTGKAFDLRNESVITAHAESASQEEIDETVKVMGGEDWLAWVRRLRDEGLLAPGARTVAYSYIGPEVSAPIYRRGTIGKAKEHLERTAREIDGLLRDGQGGGAWVSINKSVVTQSSSAIPAVPLYMSVVFKVMKERGLHEGTVEQIIRLFRDHLGPGRTPATDEAARIRLDDLEMSPEVQAEVSRIWEIVDTENLNDLTDWQGFKRDFHRLFGFQVPGIDYSQPVEVVQEI